MLGIAVGCMASISLLLRLWLSLCFVGGANKGVDMS